MSKQRLTIVDMDTLFYFSSKDNLIDSVKDFDSRFNTIIERTKADKVVSFITKGYNSFRYKLYPDYKANREGKIAPKYTRVLTEIAIADYNAVTCYDMEADDACILFHEQYKEEYDVSVAAIDSDLRQISARFYNYKSDSFEIITEKVAAFNLWKSVLTGKSKDNVPGMQGVGADTAEKYLNEAMEYFCLDYRTFTYEAYVSGISKEVFKSIYKDIKGYAILKGTRLFNLNLHLCKLLSSAAEVDHISELIRQPLDVKFLNDVNVFYNVIPVVEPIKNVF